MRMRYSAECQARADALDLIFTSFDKDVETSCPKAGKKVLRHLEKLERPCGSELGRLLPPAFPPAPKVNRFGDVPRHQGVPLIDECWDWRDPVEPIRVAYEGSPTRATLWQGGE